MPISVTCPQCEFIVKVKDEYAGKRGKCPKCKTTVQIPAAEAPVLLEVVEPDDSPAPQHAPQHTQSAATIASAAVGQASWGLSPLPAEPSVRHEPEGAVQKHAGLGGPMNTPVTLPTGASGTSPTTKPMPSTPMPAMHLQPQRATNPAPRDDSPEAVWQQVLAGFRGNIERRSPPLTYFLGVLLTTFFMIALPLAYIALIGLVCYVVGLHLVYDVGVFEMAGKGRGKGAIVALLLYLAPLLIGGILIVFMIKPLFARPSREGRKRSLTREAEPVLFAFVDKICEIVHAPIPKRIDIDCDINASAGFRRGWLSLLLGSDLVLTIGMPLVAGLSLQQFAGVLAHEFGHFSQGAGMRLTYVIRSINHWFMRVVYERDSWDDWLANSTEGLDLRIAWILYLARFFVWLTRRILWLLMMLGHLVAGFMLRQMEFDADRYETLLAGTDNFEATSRQLTVLNVAYQGAQADLGAFYREGRLADNLPRLIVANIAQIPAELFGKLNELIDNSKTGFFDTHPCDRDRIAAARKLNVPEIFHTDLPASAVFSSFHASASNVTYDYYCSIFGDQMQPSDLHPVDDLLRRQNQEQHAGEARQRFFGDHFHALRPVRLPSAYLAPPRDVTAVQERLEQARQNMAAAAENYTTAMQRFDEADTTLLEVSQFLALFSAQVAIDREKFKRQFNHAADCRPARDAALLEQSRLAPYLDGFEISAGHRLFAALELLCDPEIGGRIDEVDRKRREAVDMVPIIALVAGHLSMIVELRNRHGALAALCGHLDGNERKETLITEILATIPRVHESLLGVRGLFDRQRYPFDHAKGELPVVAYLLETPPPSDDLGAVFQATDNLMDNLISLYVRCVDRLCLLAEEVETTLGLPPLTLPTKP